MQKAETKSILRYIPGFRTNKTWKKYIAAVGYLTIASFFTAGVSQPGNPVDQGIFLAQVIFFVSVPFLLLTNFMGVRKHLPVIKSEKAGTSAAGIAGAIFIWIIISVIFIAVTSSLHTQEYQQFVEEMQRSVAEQVQKEAAGSLPAG